MRNPGRESNGNEFINGTIRYAGSNRDTGFFNDNLGFGHCVYISTSDNIVSNNDISDCSGLGVHIYRDGTADTLLRTTILCAGIG